MDSGDSNMTEPCALFQMLHSTHEENMTLKGKIDQYGLINEINGKILAITAF